MKKALKVLCAMALVFTVTVSAAVAQKATIDMKLNTAAADPKGNYLNWTAGTMSVKDAFDAATGASKAQSTQKFNAIRYDSDSTMKAAVPATLRSLVLYPVSDYNTLKNDDFQVMTNGKEVTVRFVHRGTAYQLKTDAKGNFDMKTGAMMAPKVADNVGGEFVLKPEFTKAGMDPNKMSSLDWSKVQLVPDTAAADASRKYEGSLAVTYNKNMLSVKGTLTEKK